MKIKDIRVLFFCMLLGAGNQLIKAQDITIMKFNFTANAGYSFPNLAGSLFSSQGNGSNGGGHSPYYIEIGYNYSHHGLISFYFSDASTNTGNFTFLDSSAISHNYSYFVSIVTFGVSTKYYFGHGEHFLPFAGAMVGYDFINLTTNDELPESGSVNIAHSQGTLIYQVYGGAVYYFNKWIGLDARAGFGNSYYAAIGLSFRFQITQKEYKR